MRSEVAARFFENAGARCACTSLTVEDADGVPTAGEPSDDGGPDTARAAGHKDPEVGHFALSTLEARCDGADATPEI